jgi:hypothetical protein
LGNHFFALLPLFLNLLNSSVASLVAASTLRAILLASLAVLPFGQPTLFVAVGAINSSKK